MSSFDNNYNIKDIIQLLKHRKNVTKHNIDSHCLQNPKLN